MIENLLLVGRWHALTRDQEAKLRREIEEARPEQLVFVITSAEQSRTKRNPLTPQERADIVYDFAESLGRPSVVHPVPDTEGDWVQHLRRATGLSPADTVLLSANPDVLADFEAAGFRTIRAAWSGSMPADVLAALASGGDWKALASDGTIRVYQKRALEEKILDLFADVRLTPEGELSTGRDFRVYAAGMDASLRVKLEDLMPHVRPGLIVDKGCGTGSLLVHLSALFPTSQIVGLDLSTELLRLAESHHYPNQNVTILRGNVIPEHFPPASVATAIFSSVVHEIYSYTGYDRGQVRLALRNTRRELAPGGRVVIRDGVKPPDRTVWMRCDAETERRFRRFAREFKGTGFEFEEQDGAFVLPLHLANEFLSKKDYLENWAIEVKEEFGVWTLDEWRREIGALGYRVVEARGYVNAWILENRYQGKARLLDDRGAELPFPDTTAVIVGEV